MTDFILYVRNFFVLAVLLLLLQQLAPGKELKKYIRFFSQLLLTLGFLSPVLSFFADSEDVLKKIEYEAFAENVAEISRDAERLEYVQQDYYLEKYEEAVRNDVHRIAETFADPYGLCVREADVELSGDYRVEEMEVTLAKKEGGDIKTASEKLWGNDGEDAKAVCETLKAELESYYQLEGGEAYVWYAGE